MVRCTAEATDDRPCGEPWRATLAAMAGSYRMMMSPWTGGAGVLLARRLPLGSDENEDLC